MSSCPTSSRSCRTPSGSQSEKAVLYVHEHFPERTTADSRFGLFSFRRSLRRLRAARVVPASRAAALAALAPSTIFQLHTADQTALAAMSRLVAGVPCYGLELGSDVRRSPARSPPSSQTLPTD